LFHALWQATQREQIHNYGNASLNAKRAAQNVGF